MNVQVSIPSLSIPGEIGRRLWRAGQDPHDDDDLETRIKKIVADMFVKRYQENSTVFERLRAFNHFVIEVQDDMADRSPKALASFNLHRSKHSDAIHFSVSSHLVYADLLPHYGLNDTDAYPPTEYWSHEFIHLLDWNMLSSFRTDFEAAQNGNHASSLLGPHFEDRDTGLPREWEVLLVLANFRDEGLAQLYPYLTGESTLRMGPQKAHEVFRRLFAPIMTFAHRPFLSWSVSEGSYSQDYRNLCKELYHLSYLAGPYFVIDAIACELRKREKRDEDLLSIVEETMQRMSEEQPAGVTRGDAARMVKVGLSLNLSSYMELLSNKAATHPWRPFLDMTEIAELYNFISYCGTEPSDKFMDHIYKSILYHDPELFLDSLKDVIGSPMEGDEIDLEHKRWQEGKGKTLNGSSMLKEVYARLENLEQRYRNTTSKEEREIIVFALTYLFDPEDYVKDKIAVVGHIDDLYVLRAASYLIGINEG